MGELKIFPMTYVTLEKDGRTASLVYANSSQRVINILGDLPQSWLRSDAILGITRLISAGWIEVGRGKVDYE